MRSYCWDLLMASSSDCGKVEATSLPRRATSDLRNQSRHCCLVVSALQKLHRLHHSWMWSAMWVVEVCLKLDSSSRPFSWRMGNWKKVKRIWPRIQRSCGTLIFLRHTIWLMGRWVCVEKDAVWQSRPWCYWKNTIDERSWHDWRGHPLPFLQTLVCLKEVWLALQAMWYHAI